ncbi:hypothetical protein HYW67_00455 [Candidatus Parcubacteria bacterium]|nr:hypothetical protein [Candidatus Parcubacteria bacterium]
MKEFSRLVRSFPQRRILLIGDLIVDVYHRGAPLKISAETPTVVARAEGREVSWGGAGLVCRNLLELGSYVTFVSVVGDDGAGAGYLKFSHPRLQAAFVVEPDRATTVKERFWVSGYKLLQWDHLDNRPVAAATEQAVLGAVRKHVAEADAVVVLDARHGFLRAGLARRLVRMAKQANKPIYVDSQVSQREANHTWYRGATVMSLNRREAEDVDPRFNEGKLPAALRRLGQLLKAPNVVLKLGEQGAAALARGKYMFVPAVAVKAVDTTGAGDAFLAALVLAGPNVSRRTLEFANFWAGLATTTIGAQPPKVG